MSTIAVVYHAGSGHIREMSRGAAQGMGTHNGMGTPNGTGGQPVRAIAFAFLAIIMALLVDKAAP